jgi:universal stress protein A
MPGFVLHLMHDPFGLEHWQLPLPSLKSIRNEYQDIRTRAKRDLDAMIATEQAEGLPVQVGIAEGQPQKEILRAVKDNQIDRVFTTGHAKVQLTAAR